MTDNYQTPQWLLDIFDGWFDPCPINPRRRNGLEISWRKRTYVNPPYSNPLPWVEKAICENNRGKTIALLLPVDTSTKWFAKLIEAGAHFLWFGERLRFVNNTPTRWACMLAILT